VIPRCCTTTNASYTRSRRTRCGSDSSASGFCVASTEAVAGQVRVQYTLQQLEFGAAHSGATSAMATLLVGERSTRTKAIVCSSSGGSSSVLQATSAGTTGARHDCLPNPFTPAASFCAPHIVITQDQGLQHALEGVRAVQQLLGWPVVAAGLG